MTRDTRSTAKLDTKATAEAEKRFLRGAVRVAAGERPAKLLQYDQWLFQQRPIEIIRRFLESFSRERGSRRLNFSKPVPQHVLEALAARLYPVITRGAPLDEAFGDARVQLRATKKDRLNFDLLATVNYRTLVGGLKRDDALQEIANEANLSFDTVLDQYKQARKGPRKRR